MANRKRVNMMYKTFLRKLRIEQYKPTYKPRMNAGALKG
jgi:hypothetical protein